MAKVFENPSNQYREKISALSSLWGALIGPIYFLFKGAWGHAIGTFIVLFLGAISGPGIILAIIINIIWGLNAPGILEKQYLRKGWREITPEKKEPYIDPAKLGGFANLAETVKPENQPANNETNPTDDNKQNQ